MTKQERDTPAATRFPAGRSGGSVNNPERIKDTPLPWRQLFVLCVVLLTESICWSVLIPFVPSFIAYLKGWDIDSSGYASGFPVSLFMIGQVVSGKIWGAFSNQVGRKLAISFGVLCCAVCMFFMGLSGSLWVLCFWRFSHGMLAGCSIVAKTMISELTDTTNRAKGLALVSLTWGVGTLLGPAIGGFLYNPVSSSKLDFLHISPTSFVGRHPAFLPGAVVATYNVFAVAISILFLKESNKSAKPLREVLPRSVVNFLAPVLEFVQPRLPCDKATEVTVVHEDDHTAASGSGSGKIPNTSAPPTSTCVSEPHTHFGFKQAFTNPLLRRVCFISMLICSSDMMFTEIFPLWMAANSQHGGLQLSTQQMAILLLVNGAPLVLANIVFASVIKYSGGPIRFWIASQLIYAVFTALVPTAASFSTSSRFWYTMAMGMLRKVSEGWSFALIMLFVSLTAPQGKVAIMFGIQQSTACLVRCAVPFIFAPLFAWSISAPRPFPFNHYLVFLLSVIPLVVGAYLAGFVYIPSENGSDELDVEASECSSEVEGYSNGERRSRAGSARGSLRSRYSFLGSVTGDVEDRDSLLQSSFATMAIATATNPIPGGVQDFIVPCTDGSSLKVSCERNGGTTQRRVHETTDSRDNSSQECEESDDNDEYATCTEEMEAMPPLTSQQLLAQEDVRATQLSETLDDEELPSFAMRGV
ncbi:hypothetical protein, conserved [Leishmania tarentolae]|uniref:Major facilitator superfamily (MFS) profile domain-containing protein n=1 Tax=Leishmania tarentolae TaxID=5689 RepID=A0A640KUK5_LEITA|nr:hypothetical protein, conserved [Leishmania tarentolae]